MDGSECDPEMHIQLFIGGIPTVWGVGNRYLCAVVCRVVALHRIKVGPHYKDFLSVYHTIFSLSGLKWKKSD